MLDDEAAPARTEPFGPVPPPPTARPDRRGRPLFGVVVAATLVARVGRESVQRFAVSRFGMIGLVLVVASLVVVMVLWRLGQRRRVRARGGVEFTAETVARQIADSGLGRPAFAEDGTLLGASLLVVNQHAKILEVDTGYGIFGSSGHPVGTIRQIGQSRAKKAARILTGLDQFFTHHFEILDLEHRPVLRVTRPRKLFRTRLHVFDGTDRFLGTIRQLNIFWKVRFALVDAGGTPVGHLRAENLRAWDFHVFDRYERRVATVVKSWEGWARTAFTRADHYVVRVHEPLPDPLRPLTVAAALAADLALKQDARGLL
jgi:hypothetical protein